MARPSRCWANASTLTKKGLQRNLWKAKATVLIGDYLLAKGLLLSLDHDDYQTLHILSDAVRKMSEGELLQIEKARSLNLKEEV